MRSFPTYLSAKCGIGHSIINGKGVLAKKKISKGEIISIWGGGIFDTKKLKKLSKQNPKIFAYSVGISDGFHLAMTSGRLDDCDRFNHSCDPNIGVKGQIVVVARKDIKKGEELCFDYETTDTEGCGGLPFYCNCKSKKCRKIIDGSAWKNTKFQKKNAKFLSWYIQEKIKKRRGRRTKKI